MLTYQELAEQAAKKMSTDFQWFKMLEEMAELMTAIHHFHQDKITLAQLRKEVADVEVSLAIIKELVKGEELTRMIHEDWLLVQERLQGDDDA